jgi:UPF0716 protein FxsA
MALVLFAVFIVLPLLELYVIIQVGQVIGVLPTLSLMLITGVVGAALARSQGRQAWTRLNQTLAAGRVPAREVVDGALVVFGGALLLAPGFITDAVGIFMLLAPGRALIRSVLRRSAARTPAGRPALFFYDRFPQGRGRGRADPGSAGEGRPRPGWAAGERFGSSRPPRDYDVEGSAREVDESEFHLPAGDGGAPGDADAPEKS